MQYELFWSCHGYAHAGYQDDDGDDDVDSWHA